MPSIQFGKNGAIDVESVLLRVTREKLYGYTVIEAHDRDGKRCQQMKLADDGRTLIGESKLVRLTEDGRACEKPAYIDGDGQVLPVVPSTFDAPVELVKTVTMQEMLNYRIGAVYNLPAVNWGHLVANIYTFPFTYRAGVNPKTAFLLVSESGPLGRAFLLVGEPVNVVMLGLDDQPPPQTDEVDADDIDFSEM